MMEVSNNLPALVVENTLNFKSLSDLLSGKILALRVPKFYEIDRCRYLSKIVSNYTRSSSISSGKIYMSNVDSFWNTVDKPEIKETYFRTAISTMRVLRQLCLPYISPVDLFRLEIDEIWPSGASIMQLDEKKMFFGITRIWRLDDNALPHQDVLWRETPNSKEVEGQISQLAVNVYLQSAELGGELEIWNCSFNDEDCARYGVKGSYGFNHSLLPDNSLVINPQEGDLVILNSTKVHAVRKVLQSEAITLSGFVGYWGIDKPLKYWS